MVPKLVRGGFGESIGLVGVLDSGGQRAFQEVRISGGKNHGKDSCKFSRD